MKGVIDIPMSMIVGLIIAAILLFIILYLLYSQKTGIAAMSDFGCNICHKMVGGFLNILPVNWLNPCTNIMNCCDEDTGANCNSDIAVGGR